jgi:hypothetical protein
MHKEAPKELGLTHSVPPYWDTCLPTGGLTIPHHSNAALTIVLILLNLSFAEYGVFFWPHTDAIELPDDLLVCKYVHAHIGAGYQ